MSERQYKRRSFLVDKRYQGKYVLAIIGACAFGLLLSVALFNFFSYRKLESVAWSIHLQAQSVGELFRHYLVYSMLLGLVITILMLMGLSIYYIKRTVPPLYRLRRFIEIVGEGNLTTNLDWMVDDEFKETVDGLNIMADHMRKRYADVRERSRDISGFSEKIIREGALPEHRRSLLEKIQSLKKELNS